MDDTMWMNEIVIANQVNQLLTMNEKIAAFGLTLTKEDAVQLMKDRKEALQEQQRIEFGEGILEKLVMAFCDSVYIEQEDLVDVLGRLQAIFYEYKNETRDSISDDELIEFMETSFNGECQGSLDYLEETVMANRYIRRRG